MKNWLLTALFACASFALAAQGVTLPPSGGNQKSSVSQWMGMVKVTIDYNSPDVTGPQGEDRKGKIWGQLVPYGMEPNPPGFGTAREMPWRAGANENTVFTVSHDVKIQGQTLAAGSYGFFVIPAKDAPWTLIFTKDNGFWGGYFYDPKNDVLRVTATAQDGPHQEWLNYEFTNRGEQSATCALMWESMVLPFSIEVPNMPELYYAQMVKDINSAKAYNWMGFTAAANYCTQQNIHLDQALAWAEMAVADPFAGQTNFTTLQTKASVLEKMGKTTESAATMKQAIEHPSASMLEIHNYGRALLAKGQKEEALKVFELNRKRNPTEPYVTLVGLARGQSAMGNYKEAIKHLKAALPNAPKEQENFYQGLIAKLEKGEDINK